MFPLVGVGNPSTPMPNWKAGIEEPQHFFKSRELGNSEILNVMFLTEMLSKKWHSRKHCFHSEEAQTSGVSLHYCHYIFRGELVSYLIVVTLH